jgi:hypothetical protein
MQGRPGLSGGAAQRCGPGGRAPAVRRGEQAPFWRWCGAGPANPWPLAAMPSDPPSVMRSISGAWRAMRAGLEHMAGMGRWVGGWGLAGCAGAPPPSARRTWMLVMVLATDAGSTMVRALAKATSK